VHDVLNFVGENWWWMIWPLAGVTEWVADTFDSGLAANAKRRRRKIAHREKMRGLEVEAKRRELEAKYPKPVEPICGCEHHLSFHLGGKKCNKQIGTVKRPQTCECPNYQGPEPLSQVYAEPLADL
jgi:hypothetical protein